MKQQILACAVWIVILVVVSTVEALTVVIIWPPSAYIQKKLIWLRLTAWVSSVLWWELLCRVRSDATPHFSLLRIGGKLYLCFILMPILRELGETLAGGDLVDYRGPRNPLPDWVIPLYTKHAIFRGCAAFAALSSAAWSGAVAVILAQSFRRAMEERAWGRGLSILVVLTAIGGAIKVYFEAGFSAFGSPLIVGPFGCPLAAGVCGLSAVRPVRILATLLCAASAYVWFLLTMQHIQHYHASEAFFDWSFVLFGLLLCALCVASAAVACATPKPENPVEPTD